MFIDIVIVGINKIKSPMYSAMAFFSIAYAIIV